MRTELEYNLNAGGDVNRTQIHACSQNHPQMCLTYVERRDSLDEENKFSMDLTNNQYGSLSIKASFTCGYSSMTGNGNGLAEIVVNSIQIDPNARINGIPATTLYKLVFSDGIITGQN